MRDGGLGSEQFRLTRVSMQQADQQEQYAVANCMGRVTYTLADGEMDNPVAIAVFTCVDKRQPGACQESGAIFFTRILHRVLFDDPNGPPRDLTIVIIVEDPAVVTRFAEYDNYEDDNNNCANHVGHVDDSVAQHPVGLPGRFSAADA